MRKLIPFILLIAFGCTEGSPTSLDTNYCDTQNDFPRGVSVNCTTVEEVIEVVDTTYIFTTDTLFAPGDTVIVTVIDTVETLFFDTITTVRVDTVKSFEKETITITFPPDTVTLFEEVIVTDSVIEYVDVIETVYSSNPEVQTMTYTVLASNPGAFALEDIPHNAHPRITKCFLYYGDVNTTTERINTRYCNEILYFSTEFYSRDLGTHATWILHRAFGAEWNIEMEVEWVILD